MAILTEDVIEKSVVGKMLSITHKKLGSDDVVAILEFLNKHSEITDLDLRFNEIDHNGAISLANSLKTNNTLTSLNLDYNDISVKGATALAKALKDNKTLTSLNLGHNAIGAKGAKALAGALNDGKATLTSLDLSENKIGAEGIRALADALKVNTTLTNLEVDYHQIEAAVSQEISERLERNQHMPKAVIKQFNVHLDQLHPVLDNLQKKGSKNKKYETVAQAVTTFQGELKDALSSFKKNETIEGLQAFKRSCNKAINKLELQVKPHRGIWHQLHPIIKGILGVLATLTIVPALVVATTEQGYMNTFFKTPPTKSAKALEQFKNDLEEEWKKSEELSEDKKPSGDVVAPDGPSKP